MRMCGNSEAICPDGKSAAQATISRTIVNQVQTIAIVETFPERTVMLAEFSDSKALHRHAKPVSDGHLGQTTDLDNLRRAFYRTTQGRSVFEVEN